MRLCVPVVRPLKVAYVSPTYFGEGSYVGGGERYAMELATWMSKFTETTFISFAEKGDVNYCGNLRVEIHPVQRFIHKNVLNPLSFRYLPSLLQAQVIHVHHIATLVSDLSCLAATLFGKGAYVTDHGGGADFVLNHKLPILSGYDHAFAQSEFAVRALPKMLQKKAILIKGGIDTERFCPSPAVPKQKKILFVGRLLPHKGVNYLIEAFRQLANPDFKLVIVGKAYDDRYYGDLKALAEGLSVEFLQGIDDQRLLFEYQTAYATVLPSVHKTCYGEYTAVPELMGFTLLESQACGTPVICTGAGAMSEFVDEGRTGYIVDPNSSEAIKDALNKLIQLTPGTYSEWQSNCRTWVEQFSWSSVARKHLAIYQDRP
jgi:glycosyltransferase involved in cell wall biosynthesis